jgi:S-formylglutathione hydrolase FrmB
MIAREFYNDLHMVMKYVERHLSFSKTTNPLAVMRKNTTWVIYRAHSHSWNVQMTHNVSRIADHTDLAKIGPSAPTTNKQIGV